MKVQQESAWPKGVSNPAKRALAAAGFTKIEQLVNIAESDLAKLHGMGPKALGILSESLKENGLSFKQN